MIAIALLSSIFLQPIHCQDQQSAKMEAFLSALNKFTEKYGTDGPSSQQQVSQSSLPVSVPALMNGSVTGSGLEEDVAKTHESQKNNVGSSSLEEFEQQAFKRLSAKAKAKSKGLKRPAAASSSTASKQQAAQGHKQQGCGKQKRMEACFWSVWISSVPWKQEWL